MNGQGGEHDNILLLQDGWIAKHVQAGAVRLLVAPTGRKLLIVITVTFILYEYLWLKLKLMIRKAISSYRSSDLACWLYPALVSQTPR